MSMLREDYKNDMFAGMRKYSVIQNSDGTISLNDVTQYTQIGDIFNADDVNATNKAVNDTVKEFSEVRRETEQFQQSMTQNFNKLQTQTTQSIQDLRANVDAQVSAVKSVKTVTLSVSGWSSSAPYTQSKNVSGVESSDTPIIALYISGSPSAATVKAQKKAFGYLDRAVTANGSIAFYCYEKKPTVDFTVSVKGE